MIREYQLTNGNLICVNIFKIVCETSQFIVIGNKEYQIKKSNQL